jgi:hypothetical protein
MPSSALTAVNSENEVATTPEGESNSPPRENLSPATQPARRSSDPYDDRGCRSTRHPTAGAACAALNESLCTLTAVLSWLERRSISVRVFGGWGEQLRGLSRPRAYGEIDLLYPAETWDAIDKLIADDWVKEIIGKRFAHKRAIVWQGMIVELFLVRLDDRRPYTLFWNRVRHDWPADLLGYVGDIPVASAAALGGYRAVHGLIFEQGEATATDVLRRPDEHSHRV